MRTSSEFIKLFGEQVVPDLRKRCRYAGSQVALDVMSFAEGHAMVWREAMRRGGSYLPQVKQDDLEDWIATLILKAEEDFHPSVMAYREVVDRVTADVDAYIYKYWTVRQ